jgi:hypothetical protein
VGQRATATRTPSLPSSHACCELPSNAIEFRQHSASLTHTLSKLAALSISSRLCSRPQLWTKLRVTPLLTSAYPAGSSTNPTTRFRSLSHRATRIHCSANAQLRPRPRLTSAVTLGAQKRYCQTEVTSSFANMASDRDILPAWSVNAYGSIELSSMRQMNTVLT